MPNSGLCATLILGAALLLSACQTTGEQLAALDGDASAELAGLDGDASALKPAEISEQPGGSAFVVLEPRKGITQKFALIKARYPAANVLLFAGGHGVLKLKKNRSSRPSLGGLSGNFLIRSIDDFGSLDLNVVLVDAPSDQQSQIGMRGGFRNSAAHVKDVEGIIDFVRQRTGLPVWLIGTSRGTESATFITIYSRSPVDGLILTSPVTVSNQSGRNIKGYELEKITAPVQIVYHQNDGCSVTPPSGARAIARSLPNAKVVEVKKFSGGGPAKSGPCTGKSAHGFFRIERSVVESIAAFIMANI